MCVINACVVIISVIIIIISWLSFFLVCLSLLFSLVFTLPVTKFCFASLRPSTFVLNTLCAYYLSL